MYLCMYINTYTHMYFMPDQAVGINFELPKCGYQELNSVYQNF